MDLIWMIVVVLGAGFAYGLLRGYFSSSGKVDRRAAPGRFGTEVVGESNHQLALERICGGRTDGGTETYVRASLIFEDANPHDDQAVRVDVQGSTVGYLPRASARQYRRWLKEEEREGAEVECPGVIRGGWDRGPGDRGNFGIWLDLPEFASH